MKLNVSYPTNGTQKTFDIDNDLLLRPFFDQRLSTELSAESLGDEWKGYIVRISGGNDKQGFPMKQGVLTNTRVSLLMSKGVSCYRPRRTGERKRKAVRGCIVDAHLSVISLVIVKKGDGDIPGLTDTTNPRRLAVKRATKIRKLFNLSKADDVRKYVIKLKITREGKKQRAAKKQDLKDSYAVMLAKLAKEKADAKAAAHERRRTSSTRKSRSSESA